MTNTRDDDACALSLCLGHHQFTHHAGVLWIQVADGLVSEQEVEGLAEGADECHALLLSVTQMAKSRIALICYAKRLEIGSNLSVGLIVRELVFHLHIFPSG